MLTIIHKICNRIIFILWMISCIISCGYLVISLLSYDDLLNTIIAWLCCCSQPFLYQIGLDHFDFEGGMNMLEFENNDKE